MTDSQTGSRKPISPLVMALITAVVCFASFPFLVWIIGNTYADPVSVFENELKLKSVTENKEHWIFTGIATLTALAFVFAMSRCFAGNASRFARKSAQLGAAICFATSLLAFLFFLDEFDSIPFVSGLSAWGVVCIFTLLVLIFFIGWVSVTWMWETCDVLSAGLRWAASGALGTLLFALPGHAKAHGKFLSGIDTFIACYLSLQVLLVVGLCGLWYRRHMPHELRSPEGMHSAASRYAFRESMMLASAATFLFVLSYAIYPLVYRDRLTVVLLGQLGFCVFAGCAVARGISGFLMREVRPFWILGLYVLLAELVVIIAWKLILPAAV